MDRGVHEEGVRGDAKCGPAPISRQSSITIGGKPDKRGAMFRLCGDRFCKHGPLPTNSAQK